ncbi:MAG: type IVB secretion system protein IcmW [Gammaproteobacteria bacterium]
MPGLDLESSHQFWRDYQDPMIFRVVSFMESMEEFVIDGDPGFEKAITRLGSALDKLDKFKPGREKDFVKLAAYIKMSRLLRLLQAADTIQPGSASKILMNAEETASKNKVANFFLRRNIVFERLRLLGRVFAEERLNVMVKALEGV